MNRRPSPEFARGAVALGRQLRVARERAGVALDIAATSIERHVDDLVSIEAGTCAPTLQELHELSVTYGATVDINVWPRVARKVAASPIRRKA